MASPSFTLSHELMHGCELHGVPAGHLPRCADMRTGEQTANHPAGSERARNLQPGAGQNLQHSQRSG